MKKTITAHVKGIVFTFEEDAYQMLENYLAAIRLQLGKSPDTNEILDDIEARIAELLNDFAKDNQVVITEVMVEQITHKLGDPSVFGEETEEQETAKPGVKKRLFRHPDNHMIGGVCGGLAAYLNIDPIWLRIFFVVAVIGFGFGIPLYILLWIVIPEAKTTADKLQMQGEDITIDNIKKKVTHEKEHLKEKWSSINEKAKKEQWGNRVEQFIYKLLSAIWQIIEAALKVVGALLGFAFFMLSFVLIVGAFSMATGKNWMVWDNDYLINWFNYHEFTSLIFPNNDEHGLFLTACILILTALITAFTVFASRLVGAIKSVPKELNWGTTIAFIIGVILLFNSGINVVKEFSKEQHIEETNMLSIPGDTLHLTILNDDRFSNYITGHHHKAAELISVSNEQIFFGYPLVNIKLSPDTNFHIQIKKASHGFTQKEAIVRASNIAYDYHLENQILKVAPYYSSPLNDKWREQELKASILVPLGKSIYLNKLSDRVIYDVENTSNTLDHKMVNHHWQMQTDGLRCTDCN